MEKLKRGIIYLFGFAFPPLSIGLLVGFSNLSATLLLKKPAALERAGEMNPPPALTHKPRAAILLSNEGTQITDLLAPYEILSASKAFDVFTVAPERIPSPTTGGVAVLPHYSFQNAPKADLLILPAVLDPENPRLITWVREKAPQARQILVLCEGARLAFRAGLLRNLTATTHVLSLAEMKLLAPETRWLDKTRYVSDGKLISSAGVTASIDATLYAIEKLGSRAQAETLAGTLGIRWNREQDASALNSVSKTAAPPPIGKRDFAQLFLRAGFDWFRDRVGVLIFPGMSELGLSAWVDVLPRNQSLSVFTLGTDRKVIRTLNGLDLIPSEGAYTAGPTDLLIVPSGGASGATELQTTPIQEWIHASKLSVKSFTYSPAGAAWDQALQLVTELQGPWSSRFASRMTEYPALRSGTVDQREWPIPLFARPLLIGLLGLLAAILLERRFRTRLAGTSTRRK